MNKNSASTPMHSQIIQADYDKWMDFGVSINTNDGTILLHIDGKSETFTHLSWKDIEQCTFTDGVIGGSSEDFWQYKGSFADYCLFDEALDITSLEGLCLSK